MLKLRSRSSGPDPLIVTYGFFCARFANRTNKITILNNKNDLFTYPYFLILLQSTSRTTSN